MNELLKKVKQNLILEHSEDDGLLATLGVNAQAVFGDGDDSGMLPKEKEE